MMLKQARQGVMELLLLNHPLDCPICDQAGECTLQDYAFDYGVEAARTQEPRRPAKKAIDLGPTVVFDQERCILCRRCVRFCREITGSGELGVFNRGDRSLLDLSPDTQLDNPYSMNVVDICPVGALTSKDFRFRIRVWFLDDVETVCPGCSNGCNIYASRSNNRVYRYVPRRNDSVNDTWICDAGRLSYRTITENRLTEARHGARSARYDDAINVAGQILRAATEAHGRIIGVASASATNEDLFVLMELLESLGAEPGTFRVVRGESDSLLIKAEKAPNANGARALGFTEANASLGPAALAIVLDSALPSEALQGVERIILLDAYTGPLVKAADVVLPARCFAEVDGSFTNHANRVQRLRQVVEPSFEAWSAGEILRRIAAAAGLEGWRGTYDPFEVSKVLAQRIHAFSGISLAGLDDEGRELE